MNPILPDEVSDDTHSAGRDQLKGIHPPKKGAEIKGELSGARTDDLVDVREVGDGGDVTDQSPRSNVDSTAPTAIRGRKPTESRIKII